ncbi:MAG: alanine--glyoxylate aminotransferase family protein [Anaerolineales bacterium]|nr:alanine--glyoxylate aminotransferase family protein [Anaerolineales bacterium]
MSRNLLMIPGPVEVNDDVLTAMGKSAYSHVSPEFIEAFGWVLENLRTVFSAPDGSALVIPGSGTCAMELAVASVVERGDRAVVIETGYFSWRMRDLLERHGAQVDLVAAPAGNAPSVAEVETALKKGAKILAVTHVDTSTGVLVPLKEYAAIAQQYGALVVVDGVCSVAGQELRMQEWGIDIALTASQKALAVPAGLALVMARPKAVAAFKTRKTPVGSYYADWGLWMPVMEAYQERRPAYFGTPAVNNVFALAESVRQILDEGMEARWSRHAKLSEAFKAGAAALGLKQIPLRKDLEATTLTTLYYPDGQDAAGLKRVAAAGVSLAGGLYPDLKSQYFRVGHMGNNSIGELLETLAAIEQAFDLEIGAGLAAAQKAWQR